MRILVTGSSGHLGEALVRSLRHAGHTTVGLDVTESPFTDHVGSICDAAAVQTCMQSIDAVLHTATLHKPHVSTHTRRDFIDTNITGTLNLLEAAVEASCEAFIYTSTTSVFGDSMRRTAGEPAAWVTEQLHPKAKNIYGVSKAAAEDLCEMFHRNTGLPCVVLRTSRFFLEADDDKGRRASFDDDNLKVNELLFRRVDLQDIVAAHELAISKARALGFERLIISATTPFQESDVAELGVNARAVLERYLPTYTDEFEKRGWTMLPTIDRVYDNTRARSVLNWQPRYDFESALERLAHGEDFRSPLARTVGVKGYHDTAFTDGPYPVGDF
ncbi:MAG: NAD(P)-dependent oxidoreductase [Pseudomonadaceae bacterium]|nr:NAD(P)-dependent oxidoreductase [Pseudomonadaceae bacterium]